MEAPVIDPCPPTNQGLPGTPNYGMVPMTQFTGIASFVDTDGSGGFLPTAGDLSIAVSLPPQNSFSGSNVSIKAVCILTVKDTFLLQHCFALASTLVLTQSDQD